MTNLTTKTLVPCPVFNTSAAVGEFPVRGGYKFRLPGSPVPSIGAPSLHNPTLQHPAPLGGARPCWDARSCCLVGVGSAFCCHSLGFSISLSALYPQDPAHSRNSTKMRQMNEKPDTHSPPLLVPRPFLPEPRGDQHITPPGAPHFKPLLTRCGLCTRPLLSLHTFSSFSILNILKSPYHCSPPRQRANEAPRG